MSTATETNKIITYVPFQSKEKLELSIALVRDLFATPTKKGKIATDKDCMKFIILCQARELDPRQGDAFLIGYDTEDGAVFNTITAHQALLKRAVACPEYDGLESGVIVKDAGGEFKELIGDFIPPNCQLYGGWAKVYSKGQRVPITSRLDLKVYSTGKSRWLKDPGGMIVKCAEADSFRRAFPNKVSQMYISEEMKKLQPDEVEVETDLKIPQTIHDKLDQQIHGNGNGKTIDAEKSKSKLFPDNWEKFRAQTFGTGKNAWQIQVLKNEQLGKMLEGEDEKHKDLAQKEIYWRLIKRAEEFSKRDGGAEKFLECLHYDPTDIEILQTPIDDLIAKIPLKEIISGLNAVSAAYLKLMEAEKTEKV